MTGLISVPPTKREHLRSVRRLPDPARLAPDPPRQQPPLVLGADGGLGLPDGGRVAHQIRTRPRGPHRTLPPRPTGTGAVFLWLGYGIVQMIPLPMSRGGGDLPEHRHTLPAGPTCTPARQPGPRAQPGPHGRCLPSRIAPSPGKHHGGASRFSLQAAARRMQ